MQKFNIYSKILLVFLLILMVSVSLPSVLAQDNTANLQQNEKIAWLIIDGLWNGEDIDIVYAVYADPFLAHSPANDGTMDVTPDFWRELVGVNFRNAFPDMIVTIDRLASTEDVVIVHYTFQGTFTNPLSRTQPATGELVIWDGVFIFRIDDGKIVEEWWYWVNPVI